MRHHSPLTGVASTGQLPLFVEPWQCTWPGDAAGHHQGRSPHPGCQEVLATFARIEVLERAGLALLTGPVPLPVAQQLALDALRVGLAGNEDTVEDTMICVVAFFRYATHHGIETLDEIDEEIGRAHV